MQLRSDPVHRQANAFQVPTERLRLVEIPSRIVYYILARVYIHAEASQANLKRATKDCYLHNRTLRSSLCLLGHLHSYLKAELRYIKFKFLAAILVAILEIGVIDFWIFDLYVSQFIFLNTWLAFISNSRAEIRLNWIFGGHLGRHLDRHLENVLLWY